jgi:hypothetical protein
MYDYYEPVPALACLWCGGKTLMWQGKDGPNLLYVWRQGFQAPVDDASDPEYQATEEVRLAERLPEHFTILGVCERDHVMRAEGKCTDGVWTDLDLSVEEAKVEEKHERDRLRELRGY